MTTTNQDVRSAPIDATTLNLDLFEDPELAEDLSEDILRVFQATEDAFGSMQSQSWYKRLWATLSGGNTRALARGCQNLGEAQHLLMRVLEVGQAYTRRSNELMVYVTRGLRHMEDQQNEVVRHLLHVDGRVGLLEEEMDLYRAHVALDPADVRTWSSHDRLVLFSVMLAASIADGEIQPEELALLRRSLERMELDAADHDRAIDLLLSRTPLTECGADLDSTRMRLVIYRHAVGIAFAHGRLDVSERAFLRQLSTYLHLRREDADRVIEGFERLQHVPSVDELARLMAPASRNSEERRRAVAEAKRKRERVQEEARVLEQSRREAYAEVMAVGRPWTSTLAEGLADWMVAPIVNRAQDYGAADVSGVSELVGWWTSEFVSTEVNPNLKEVYGALHEVVGHIDEAVRLPADVHQRLSTVWPRTVDDDAGWDRAFAAVQQAGVRLANAEPSGVWNFARGGAAGAIGAALLGPVGIAGAFAANYFMQDSDEKELDAACDGWDQAVRDLFRATDAWRDRAESHLKSYLLYVAESAAKGVQNLSDYTQMQAPVHVMSSHLASLRED